MPRAFSSIACLAALALLLLAAWPARATEYSAADLLPRGPQSAPEAETGFQPYQAQYLPGRFLPTGDPELLSTEIIRDENRFKLELFTLSRETLIPLASAHLYIIHAARISQIKRSKVEELPPEERPPPPWNIKYLPSDPTGLADLADLAEGLNQVEKFRSLLDRAPVPEIKGWSPLDWLTEEDGLLSGRPWSWDNFLPRLLTVGGVVVGGLLAVEILRALLAMGARAIGGKERQDRPS